MNIFDTLTLQQLIHDSAQELQTLLPQYPDTRDLGSELSNHGDLQKMLDLRFTVAIVGQMKAGKSTLMNALIGRDLAPVGVTETTATINYFRHGSGDLCDQFRIHWKDGSQDTKPLAELQRWVTEENIPRITSVDFFADAKFLETANIVDTPGTRSVLKDHQQTTKGFLGETYGGKADAVIYVINPVARKSDVDMLAFFGEKSRLPGASPANSIAVFQKWDVMDNPLATAQRLCERLQQDLTEKVSEVIPTSGLLTNATRILCEETWQNMARLGQSPELTCKRILRLDKYFGENVSGASLTDTERKYPMESVRTSLGAQTGWWSVLRFSVQLAHEEDIDDGAALRKRVLEASGFEALRNTLEARFFSRKTLLQPLTLLRKLSEPAKTAELRLDNKLAKKDLEVGTEVLYQEPYNTDSRLDVIRHYINDIRAADKARKDEIQKVAKRLGYIKQRVEDAGDRFDTDMKCLDTLKVVESVPRTPLEDRELLERLFGAHGTAVWQRLGLESEAALDARAFDRAQQLLHRYQQMPGTEFADLYERASELLQAILSYLKQTTEKSKGRKLNE